MTDELNLTENINSASEVVMSFDTTGSMASAIQNVRRHMEKTVEEMFQLIPDLRVGFIAHGDYCDGANCYETLPLTNDKAAVYKFIRTAKNTGGGDAPECYELAMHLARGMGWSDKRGGKILVMIGDASPHAVNYPGNKDKLDWRKELAHLKEMGINVYPLQCLYAQYQKDVNEFWSTISETCGTPLLKLQDFANSASALTGVVAASSGTEVFRAYNRKLVAKGLVPDEIAFMNCALEKEAAKYDFVNEIESISKK
jgi:hypothetical protein